MSRYKLVIIVILLILCSNSYTFSQAKLELTEIQKLKSDNYILRVKLTQCSVTVSDRDAKLASLILQSEQSSLVEEFRKQLNAEKNSTYDWDCHCFKSNSK